MPQNHHCVSRAGNLVATPLPLSRHCAFPPKQGRSWKTLRDAFSSYDLDQQGDDQFWGNKGCGGQKESQDGSPTIKEWKYVNAKMARRCQSGTQNRSLLHKMGHCRKECKGWIPNKVANFSEKEDFSPRYRISLYTKKTKNRLFYLLDYKVTVVQTF